jgi:hypothetical protein
MNPYAYTLTGVVAITLIKITCFIVGYLIIRLGAMLIALRVESQYEISGTYASWKAFLKSKSPGLTFVICGAIIVGYAMCVDKPVVIEIPPRGDNQMVEAPMLPSEIYPSDTTDTVSTYYGSKKH